MLCEKSIEDRLAELEKSDTAKTREIRSLQEHRHKLENKILSLQDYNLYMETKVIECQTESLQLKEKIGCMENRLSALEKKTKRLNDVQSALHSNNQRTVNEVTNLVNKFGNVETSVVQLSGLHKVLNRSLVGKQNILDVNKKVHDLNTRTISIEHRLGKISQSITRVELALNGDLITKQRVKLDRCVKVLNNNGGMFNRTSGCVIPTWDGDYCAGVRFGQVGEGDIEMWLNWDGSGGHVEYLAKTGSHNDASFGMTCVRLKNGQSVWIEAKRLKGNPRVWWCEFLCWLL